MNVLLVEDNDNTATLTEMYMEKTGFADNVDRTYRIKPFEHLCNVNKYNVIVIDYHLQFYDAPEFIQVIKKSKLNSNTPVVVISHELSKWEEDEISRMGLHYVRRHDDYMIFIELIRRELRNMN